MNSGHLEQQQQQRKQQHDGQHADGGDGEAAAGVVVPLPPRLHHHTAAVPPPAPLSKGSHARSVAEGDGGGPSPLLPLQPIPLPPVTLTQLIADSRKQLSLARPLVQGLLVQVGGCHWRGRSSWACWCRWPRRCRRTPRIDPSKEHARVQRDVEDAPAQSRQVTWEALGGEAYPGTTCLVRGRTGAGSGEVHVVVRDDLRCRG